MKPWYPFRRSCKEVTALVIAREDRALPWQDRMGLRLHMALCSACPPFERQVLKGESDESLLNWVRTNGRKHSDQEIAEWSKGILTGGPKDDAAKQRYQGRLQDIATKRGVPVTALPPATTWVDAIELDEGRM